MKIANRTFFRAVVEGLKKYVIKDRKYIIAAIPMFMSKFAPSGSLKDINSVFEHAIAVIPKISNEILFDVKYIFLLY